MATVISFEEKRAQRRNTVQPCVHAEHIEGGGFRMKPASSLNDLMETWQVIRKEIDQHRETMRREGRQPFADM